MTLTSREEFILSNLLLKAIETLWSLGADSTASEYQALLVKLGEMKK